MQLPEFDRAYAMSTPHVFAVGDFKIVSRVDNDEVSWGISDFVGTGVSKPGQGCIRHRGGHGEYEWFMPSTPAYEHYRDLLRLGWEPEKARHEAAKYSQESYQRWKSYGHDWWFTIVSVSIHLFNINLWESSCGGIDSDSGGDYYREILYECLGEAIDGAKKTLGVLVSGVDQSPLDQLDQMVKDWMEQQRKQNVPSDPSTFEYKRTNEEVAELPSYTPVFDNEYWEHSCIGVEGYRECEEDLSDKSFRVVRCEICERINRGIEKMKEESLFIPFNFDAFRNWIGQSFWRYIRCYHDQRSPERMVIMRDDETLQVMWTIYDMSIIDKFKGVDTGDGMRVLLSDDGAHIAFKSDYNEVIFEAQEGGLTWHGGS